MASLNGRMVACDRCGKTVFLKSTGEGETDGGFTRWNNFEEMPKEWGHPRDCVKFCDLCPECNKTYLELLRGFENG